PGGGIKGVGDGRGDLRTETVAVAVGPVDQVIDGVALLGGNPLGAGGLFQTEIRVEATYLDLHRAPAGIGDGRLVEIAVVRVAGVMREVVVELVFPVGEGHASNLEERAAEIGCIRAVAVVGVDTVELAVISLQAATNLETELLFRGCH